MRLGSALASRQLLLLPPQRVGRLEEFRSSEENPSRYRILLENLQRLRGKVYLEDGAIQPWDLTSDGRHKQAADAHSWHVLSVDRHDNVYGCARLRAYDLPFDYNELAVRQAEIAYSDHWKSHVERAVHSEMLHAMSRGIGFTEVGGWALSEELRCSTEALRIALATFGLGQRLGHCIGLTTATVRHCSSTILRRMGGSLLSDNGTVVPRYFDSRYNCDMEILRFDSSDPNPKFRDLIQSVAADLGGVQVVRNGSLAAAACAAGRSESSWLGRASNAAFPSMAYSWATEAA